MNMKPKPEAREIILLKYGEIVLKGLNRSYFSQLLEKNVRNTLRHADGVFSLEYSQSILFVRGEEGSDSDMESAFAELKKVFGVISLCKGWECEKDLDVICALAKKHARELLGNAERFKCDARRGDKKFPFTSPQIAAACGGAILEAVPSVRVDVHEPEVVVTAEIRDRTAILHGSSERGAGGMPVGCEGKAMLLLSGGIDSPVAGYMTARRGVALEAVYFETPPYTSEAAREKVVALARKLAEYTGGLRLHSVSLTEIQETLASTCEERLFTLLLRRFMIRCAEELAKRNGASALVTGESIGQVASQTMLSLVVTNEPATLPVFRPCIGLDKEEIIVRARSIGTMEISSLPFEDCCAMFTPKHPNTRPAPEEIHAEEAKLDVAALVARALATDRPEWVRRR